jgi:hypothetical protein
MAEAFADTNETLTAAIRIGARVLKLGAATIMQFQNSSTAMAMGFIAAIDYIREEKNAAYESSQERDLPHFGHLAGQELSARLHVLDKIDRLLHAMQRDFLAKRQEHVETIEHLALGLPTYDGRTYDQGVNDPKSSVATMHKQLVLRMAEVKRKELFRGTTSGMNVMQYYELAKAHQTFDLGRSPGAVGVSPPAPPVVAYAPVYPPPPPPYWAPPPAHPGQLMGGALPQHQVQPLAQRVLRENRRKVPAALEPEARGATGKPVWRNVGPDGFPIKDDYCWKCGLEHRYQKGKNCPDNWMTLPMIAPAQLF